MCHNSSLISAISKSFVCSSLHIELGILRSPLYKYHSLRFLTAYQLVETIVRYDGAVNGCRERGTTLVTIDSAEKHDEIKEFAYTDDKYILMNIEFLCIYKMCFLQG